MTIRLLALAALALSGCAATTHAIDPAAEPDRLAWANDLFASRPTTVVLEDGTAYDATALRLEADTTTWIDPATQSLVSIPTSAVLEVERRDGGRSVSRVVRRGIVAGAIASGLLFAAAGVESGGCFIFCGSEPPTTGERVRAGVSWGVGGAMIGAFYGVVGGTVVGVASSPTERFEVVSPSRTGLVPSRASLGLEAAENGPSPTNRAP
ncbi:hypothetical protein [Rubrivirga sp.]|uniref:hypothetical protein n=1 Tax=Rubrivirga sp. TaxID=1885344 RepID=UPI003C7924A2